MDEAEDRKATGIDSPHLAEFRAFLQELNKETPRGLVQVSCSMIDELVGKTIQGFLADDKIGRMLLEGFNAPLGTLSARVAMAFALGLISRQEFSESEILRKVRNEFAHKVTMSFDNPKIRGLCASLTMCAKDYGEVRVDARGRYSTAAVALILNLTNRPHYVAARRLQYEPWPY